MLEKIQESDIKKYFRYISLDLNTSSRLYYHSGSLHKLLHPWILENNSDLENILNYINSKKLNNCVYIENLIYYYELFIGYTVKFYKNYKSLRRSLNRNFNLKKEDCYNILKAIQTLNDNSLKYSDFHLGNFLVNDNNILITDLDSMKFILDDYDVIEQNRMTMILCLAYLYKIPVIDMFLLLKNNQIFPKNYIMYDLINNCSVNNLLDFQNFIDLIQVKDIKESRGILKYNVKKIRSNSYYQKYYR